MSLIPVTVPAKIGEPPFLELHLSIDEILQIMRRHLERSSASGALLVQFRVERHTGRRGLTTIIHCVKDEPS